MSGACACLHAATGTDAAVNQAVASLAGTIPLDSLGGVSLEDFVRSIPEAVQAIESPDGDPVRQT
jgi:hypothetical protein